MTDETQSPKRFDKFTCKKYFKKYINIEKQKQMYLCFWELCLSEALRTPPGQLSSEQEQRKQQNQEPGVGEFSGFKFKD